MTLGAKPIPQLHRDIKKDDLAMPCVRSAEGGASDMNMRRFWILVAALAATCPAAINAQDANPPEIVQFESARVLADLLFVTMASTGKRYSLDCHTKNPGCITPLPKTNYLLFDKNARWKMPGAKEFLTLKFVHDWVGTYREDDIGLVPAEGGAPNELGVFVLESVKVR